VQLYRRDQNGLTNHLIILPSTTVVVLVVNRNKLSLEMIASTAFSVIFLLVIVTKTSSMDLATAKKVLVKPLYEVPHVDNQNSVPVSEKINQLLIYCGFWTMKNITNVIAIFFQKITVSIYYGSLCSDSMDLFKNQIGPNLAKFQKYVNFDFVPFGKSDVSVLI